MTLVLKGSEVRRPASRVRELALREAFVAFEELLQYRVGTGRSGPGLRGCKA